MFASYLRCVRAVFPSYLRCVCAVLYLRCVCAESAVSEIIAIDTASAVFALRLLCVGARMTLCRRSMYVVGVVVEILKVTAICCMFIEVRVELSARLKGGRS